MVALHNSSTLTFTLWLCKQHKIYYPRHYKIVQSQAGENTTLTWQNISVPSGADRCAFDPRNWIDHPIRPSNPTIHPSIHSTYCPDYGLSQLTEQHIHSNGQFRASVWNSFSFFLSKIVIWNRNSYTKKYCLIYVQGDLVRGKKLNICNVWGKKS